MTKKINVTVFGGSAPQVGEPAYDEALRLGKLLGARGWTVLTGGYMGTMEATSRGANEAGGHVIGVTCAEIENYRTAEPNPWVIEKRHYESLRDRMYALIDGCDVAVALPGGIGTLTEIAAMWSTVQTDSKTPRPLILVGDTWRQVFELFSTLGQTYVRPPHVQLLQYADTVEEVIAQIEAHLTP